MLMPDFGQAEHVYRSVHPADPQLQSHFAHHPVSLSLYVPVGQALTHLPLNNANPWFLSHLMHFGVAVDGVAENEVALLPAAHVDVSDTHFRHPIEHSLQVAGDVLESSKVLSGQLSTHRPIGAIVLPVAHPVQKLAVYAHPLHDGLHA